MTGAGNYAYGHPFHDVLPVLPLVQLGKVIGPHQPNEFYTWVNGLKSLDGFGGKSGPKVLFDVRDGHLGVLHNLSGMRNASGHISRPFGL